MRTKIPIALCVMLMALGCSAAKTTFVDVDSQGNLTPCPDRCVKGVPAVVKVKTHVEVSITQTDYYQKAADNKSLTWVPEATLRTYDVRDIMMDKMVMIDPKRPASGEGEFKIAYSTDGSGQMTSVNYKAVDTTLKDSAALATAALKAFGVKPQSNVTDATNSTLVEVKRVIAVERFPADQCSQAEIERFIGQHINNCAPKDCSTQTLYAPAKKG